LNKIAKIDKDDKNEERINLFYANITKFLDFNGNISPFQ
jgi:hypothetical protein